MTKERSNTKYIWLLFYLFVFIFLLRNSFNYLDPDFGWHLQVGQEILNNKSVPTIEYYDYTLAGKNWVDHEWLANAAVYLVYHYSNYIILNILFALLVVAVLLLLNFYIKKYIAEPKNFFLLPLILIPSEILGILAISPHAGVRLQELGMLFLVLLLIIIKIFEKNKNWKNLFWLIPLFYIWSCSHGSFLIGFFILGLYAMIKSLEIFIHRWPRLSFLDFSNLISKNDLFVFFGFSGLAFFTTLFTPYGLKLYLFLLDYANNFYAKHISEWLSAFTYPFQYYQLFYLSIAGAILLIYFVSCRYSKKQQTIFLPQLDLWQICLFLIFLLLALKSKRHFPLFFIVSLPTIAKILMQELAHIKQAGFLNHLLVKFYTLIAFALTITALLLTTNFTNAPFANAKFCSYFPCAALNFLKGHQDYQQLKIFNSYNWGGYLIRVWPEKQLFIDGRLPQYPLKNHTFLEEYYEFFDAAKTKGKLDEYEIKLVLLRVEQPTKVKGWEKFLFDINEDKLNENLNPLMNYLDKSTDWQNVYQDSIARIYIRK